MDAHPVHPGHLVPLQTLLPLCTTLAAGLPAQGLLVLCLSLKGHPWDSTARTLTIPGPGLKAQRATLGRLATVPQGHPGCVQAVDEISRALTHL